MRLLQQLQLFPVVFSPPPELQQLLGTGYGAQCVEVAAAAEKLVGALEMQVRGSTNLQYTNLATIYCNHCITTSPSPPNHQSLGLLSGLACVCCTTSCYAQAMECTALHAVFRSCCGSRTANWCTRDAAER